MSRSWSYDRATLRVASYAGGTSQLAGSSTGNLMLLSYLYDDSGNVTRIHDALNSSQYECYGYDTSNRLVDAFTGNSACSAYSSSGLAPFDHAYTYDTLHSLTSLDGPSYTYGTANTASAGDAGPHAVVAVGSTLSFGYDNNGNRITRTDNSVVTSYSYSPENRLSSVDLPSDSDDVVFVYDADGRRVSRSHGDHSTVYVAGVLEIDRDTTTVTETRTLYAFAGTTVATRTHSAAATVFLFQNHLGSTVAAFDDTADTRIAQFYYPYGAERHAVGTLPIDQRYTGQTSDATGAASGDTGLLFYNARYYDPQVGAFAAADTIVPTVGLSVGLNRYAYVAGNPTSNVDPTGNGWIQVQAYVVGDAGGRNPDSRFETGDTPETIAAINQAKNEGRVTDRAGGGYEISPLNPTRDMVGPDTPGRGSSAGALVSSLGLVLEAHGHGKGSRRLRIGGALLGSLPDAAEVREHLRRGEYGDALYDVVRISAKLAGSTAGVILAKPICGRNAACLLAGLAIGTDVGDRTYRAATASIGEAARATGKYLEEVGGWWIQGFRSLWMGGR